MRVWIIGVVIASSAHAEPLPRFAVSADPVLYAFSDYYDVAAAVRIGDNLAIAPDIAHWRSGDDPAWHTGMQLAIGVPYYFDHAFEGTFVEPRLVMRTEDNTENTHDYEGPGVLVGVQHTWDVGVTFAAAIGANLPLHTMLSSSDMAPLDGYMHIGYTF